MTVLLFFGLGIVGIVVLVVYSCLCVSAQSERDMERYIQSKKEKFGKDPSIDDAQKQK